MESTCENNANTHRPYYYLKEFAALFGMERTWAYRLMQAGKILVIAGYGKIKVPHSEYEKMLNDKGRYLGRKNKKKAKDGEP